MLLFVVTLYSANASFIISFSTVLFSHSFDINCKFFNEVLRVYVNCVYLPYVWEVVRDDNWKELDGALICLDSIDWLNCSTVNPFADVCSNYYTLFLEAHV